MIYEKEVFLPVLVFVCIVVLLSACGNSSQEIGDSVPSKADSIATEESGSHPEEENDLFGEVNVSVTTPEGWEPYEGSPHPAEYYKGTARFIVMNWGFNASNLDELVEKAKSTYPSTYKDIEYIGEVENLTVDGKDARKFVFTYDAGAARCKCWNIFLLLGKDSYLIVFTDMVGNFDDNIGDYEQILKSISFN